MCFYYLFKRHINHHYQSILLSEQHKKTHTDTYYYINVIRTLHFFSIAYIAFFLASTILIFTPLLYKFLLITFIIILFYQFCISINIVVIYIFEVKLHKEESKRNLDFFAILVKIAFGIAAFITILFILNVNVGNIFTGLGIGGVVVALALQSILGDLFSSFSIYLDKPFVVGDFVIIDNEMGVIKRIGIKTTRIRSLQGEEIIISNKDITAGRIHNYKRMKSRRILLTFGVSYNTPIQNLRLIPEIIKEIVKSIDLIYLDRAHASAFGNYSFVYEVVYYVQSGDYNIYMDKNQEILFRIKEELNLRNIEITIPAQKLFMQPLLTD